MSHRITVRWGDTSRVLRLVTLLVCLLLVAAACRRGQPEATEEPATPSPTPGPRSLGEFQLVATIEQAFVGVEPDVDLPRPEQEPLEEGAGGRVNPPVNGVARVVLEAFSDNMRDQCGADAGDRFNMFWSRQALFDPAFVSADDLELALDDERVGVIGTVYRRAAAEEDDLGFDLDASPSPSPSPAATTTPQATTTPEASPGPTTGEGEEECVLVAEQVGATTGELPTPRPTRAPRRTASPSPTGTSTVTPTAKS